MAAEEVEDDRKPFRALTRQSLAEIEARTTDQNGGSQPDPRLEDGALLPLGLRSRYPRELAGKPIEDIDPFYRNQGTFVAISKGKYISRFSATKALWMFDPLNSVRRLAISTLLHPLFSIFILITILVNCFFLIMPVTPVIGTIDLVFLGIYTFEFNIKLIARGFILKPFTCLRDGWNWLDVIVIVLGYMCLGSEEMQLLPCLKALRALKIVPIVPGLKAMHKAVKDSAKNLLNVFFVIMFFLLMFTLLGVQIYMGVLTQKCIRQFPDDGSWGNMTDENWLAFVQNDTNWYETGYEYPVCGNSSGAGACPPGYTCIQGFGGNPNYGYTNYDTFGWGLLATFRLMTRDYWENLYQLVLRAAGPWHMIFFIVIIFFGSFYFVNCLVFAMIIMSYSKFQKKTEDEEIADKEAMRKAKEAAKENRKRNVATALDGEQGKKESLLDGEDGGSKGNPFIETAQHQTDEDMKDVMVLNDNIKMATGKQSAANEHVDYYFPSDEDDESPKSKGKLSACCSKVTDMFCVWDCCRPWVKFQKIVAVVALNPFFELFIMLCIILNTLFMALDHHDMNRDMERALKRGNYLFTSIFAIEAILKIIAMSPKYYFQKAWNRFDFIIVAMALIELGLEGIQGLSVLRSFRILRILRLAKWWPTLNVFLSSMGKTSKALQNLTFLLSLVIFIFAVMGMELFGRNYIENIHYFPDEELPRWNFTDFMHSFMIVFRALCGEWIESMWDCMLVADVTCIPFFLAIVIIGNLVVLNFFVALLLSSIGSSNQPAPAADSETKKIAEAFGKIGRFLNWITCNVTKLVRTKTNNQISDETPGDSSAPIEQGGSNIRLKCYKLIENKFFRGAIVVVILIGSTVLALEDVHLPQRPILWEILGIIDLIFMAILLLEMLIRWVALGFKKYFTNAWCWLDFIIIMSSVISFVVVFIPTSGPSALHFIQIVCMLRPLMVVSRCESLRVAASTFLQSIPSILKLLVVLFIFWLIFAIMGVQLFAGKYYKCVDENGTYFSYQAIQDRNACLTKDHIWENSPMNFDHIGNAFLSLTQVASFKGWIQIMNDAIDSREVFMQPIRELNIYMYLYFVFFIIFGSFFSLNQLMVVIIDFYNERKEKAGGFLVMFMTENQKKKYNEMKKSGSEKPVKAIPRPMWKPQAVMYDVCTSKSFDIAIMVVLICYALATSLEHYQQSEAFSFALDIINLIVILIFLVECVIKIFALRQHYFKEPWNIFDFLVVVLSVLGLVLADLIEKYFVSPTLLRLARVWLILRLLKLAKGLRSLLSTLAMTLSSLLNICTLFSLITFVYAIIGMSLFKHVKDKSGLDDVYNFKTFGQSMILLFQISTSAGWDGVLDAVINEENCSRPNYETGFPGDCGSRSLGITFILSYLAITFVVVINTFVAIVLENISQTTEDEEEHPPENDR